MVRARVVGTLASIVVACAASLAHAAESGTPHLLKGAAAFRAGRFSEALVEFRVAAKLDGPGEADWYVAATLVKLGRFEDSLVRFDDAARTAPGRGDVVMDFYRSVACYELRLFRTADRMLENLGNQAGPQLAAESERMRERIAALFTAPPADTVLDWYLARAELERAAGHRVLARAYYDEAAQLSALRPAPYKAEVIASGLRALDDLPPVSPNPQASPSAPQQASPSAPQQASPSAQRQATPSAQRQATPSAQQQATPSAQQQASPSAPQQASTSAPPQASPSDHPEHTRSAQPDSSKSAHPEGSPAARPDGLEGRADPPPPPVTP